MILAVTSCTLNYYREDILSRNEMPEIFRVRFVEFAQVLLREFGVFYDKYFRGAE
jgi:hypothetical protein